MDRKGLIEHLDKNADVLRSESLKEAFASIDRADFVGEDYKIEAYEDYALPSGNGTTVTKPTLAAFMLEVLDPKPGDAVLEVGSGTGWMTALIARMVGASGSVTAVEIVPEFVEEGRRNIAKYDLPQVRIEHAGDELGKASSGPYDRIICMADANELPEELKGQLKDGGTLVMPVNGSIVRVTRNGLSFDEKIYPETFIFSPLV